MSRTITIYQVTMPEQGSLPSLEPWGGNTLGYEGWDDGGKTYILPDGWHAAKDGFGIRHIYANASNFPAELTNGPDGTVLLDGIKLEVADQAAVALGRK
jgi:hypothetical protein